MKYTKPSAGIFRAFSVCVIMAGLYPWTALPAQIPASPVSMKRCWEYPAANLKEQGVSSDGMRAYLAEDGARLEAVSITDGSRVWFSDLGGEIVSNVVESNGAVFVATASKDQTGNFVSASVRSLSKETGITNWLADLPASQRFYAETSAGSLIMISEKGQIKAFDAATGAKRWNFALDGNVTAAPNLSAGRLIIPSDAPGLTILSANDGSLVQKRAIQHRSTAVFLLNNGEAAWGDDRGNLSLFNVGSDKLNWKFKEGAAVSDIGMIGDLLLVTSDDNFVYAIATSNGNVRWKKRQTDRVFKPGILNRGLIVLSSKADGRSTLLESDHGRVLDQIQPSGGSSVIQFPVTVGDSILIPASNGVSAYSLNGCPAK